MQSILPRASRKIDCSPLASLSEHCWSSTQWGAGSGGRCWNQDEWIPSIWTGSLSTQQGLHTQGEWLLPNLPRKQQYWTNQIYHISKRYVQWPPTPPDSTKLNHMKYLSTGFGIQEHYHDLHEVFEVAHGSLFLRLPHAPLTPHKAGQVIQVPTGLKHAFFTQSGFILKEMVSACTFGKRATVFTN